MVNPNDHDMHHFKTRTALLTLISVVLLASCTKTPQEETPGTITPEDFATILLETGLDSLNSSSSSGFLCVENGEYTWYLRIELKTAEANKVVAHFPGLVSAKTGESELLEQDLVKPVPAIGNWWDVSPASRTQSFWKVMSGGDIVFRKTVLSLREDQEDHAVLFVKHRIQRELSESARAITNKLDSVDGPFVDTSRTTCFQFTVEQTR